MSVAANESKPVASNFLRQRIAQDQAATPERTIATRFPPEPNGYLHIGHAKSIFLNFGLARDFNGVCNMRFDDTNPEKENQEFVDGILDSVSWLGFDPRANLLFASDYFEKMYACAVSLLERGLAYVDSQTAEQMRLTRGTLTQAGSNSPFRERSPAENCDLFRRMRAGEFAEGTHIVRAKIDMSSPNINLRDPAIYRIRFAHHHRTGDTWCLYPMYDYAHPIEDALEGISHSICTLEFEDHRPFYDWLLEHLAQAGQIQRPVPQQFEFARLNLTHTVMSKRKLAQLVQENHVSGWDDPRMPTLVGLRRRGFTAASLELFCERIGVSKADSWIDYSTLEQCLRDVQEPSVPRATAVLQPLKLIIDNYDAATAIACHAPAHPNLPELGQRHFNFERELWIENSDFMLDPPKGFFRLFPGNKVRLRYGFVVECTGVDQDADGNVLAVHANYFPDSQSGTPGSANYKVKGNIQWLGASEALPAELRLYDHLFTEQHPGAGGSDLMASLNPQSEQVIEGLLEPGLVHARAGEHFQFERYGYFVCDQASTLGGLRFNRTVGLKDSFKS
jgi:glutaminyl-tRNA synthetase